MHRNCLHIVQRNMIYQELVSSAGDNNVTLRSVMTYSTGRSKHDTDFAKTNQNEVVQIRTNFFEDFRIRKLIRENEFVILNL